MKTKALLALALLPIVAVADMEDDPFLIKVMVDSLEMGWSDDGQTGHWDVYAWSGYDLNKIWVKTEGEWSDAGTEAAQLQLLYGRAIAPYWDIQVGWRHDFEPGPAKQDWLAASLQGTAPYFFEAEFSAFVDADGNTAFSLTTERELMITQQWVLAPELEVTAYGQEDAERGRGSGLATLEAGLRLRYEVTRHLAPYAGVNWERSFGTTADLQRLHDGHANAQQWVLGVRAWF